MCTLMITVVTKAHAESTTLSQRILPLNCIFETVNDGTGTIHFLTPEACGVLLPPAPPIVEPTVLQPSDNTSGIPVSEPITFQPQTSQPITSIPLPAPASTEHPSVIPQSQNPGNKTVAKAPGWWHRNHKVVLVTGGATLALVLLVLLLMILL